MFSWSTSRETTLHTRKVKVELSVLSHEGIDESRLESFADALEARGLIVATDAKTPREAAQEVCRCLRNAFPEAEIVECAILIDRTRIACSLER